MTSSECEHSSSRSIAHEFAKQMDANFGHASTTTDIAYRGRWQQHTGIGEALECGMGTPSPRSTALSRRLVPYVVHHVSTNSWVVTIRKPCNRDAEGRASSNQFRCFRWACPERGTSVHTLASFSSSARLFVQYLNSCDIFVSQDPRPDVDHQKRSEMSGSKIAHARSHAARQKMRSNIYPPSPLPSHILELSKHFCICDIGSRRVRGHGQASDLRGEFLGLSRLGFSRLCGIDYPEETPRSVVQIMEY
ncbi:hypothetical protein AB1N83_006736 [Pleurotus pulmonarius]